jgi:hypothetical protein
MVSNTPELHRSFKGDIDPAESQGNLEGIGLLRAFGTVASHHQTEFSCNNVLKFPCLKKPRIRLFDKL